MNTPSQKNEIDLRDVSFEYPVTLEPEVINQIRLLQGPMNPSLAVWLSRRGRYEALISAELRRAQMPKELLAVAMIESGFSPDAFSPAGAVGLWQFMHSTATSMGARIDDWVDERRHVQASTRLAIKLLKNNYKRFQDWHLALAAYNAGAGAVERAIKKSGSSNYWTIIRMGHLPREASQYVPRAIAGMIAIRMPALFGQESLRLQSQPRLEYVSVSSGTDLHRLKKTHGLRSNLSFNITLNYGVVLSHPMDMTSRSACQLNWSKSSNKPSLKWIKSEEKHSLRRRYALGRNCELLPGDAVFPENFVTGTLIRVVTPYRLAKRCSSPHLARNAV